MKERQILFKGEMVRAILSGQKTQTRRVVKPRYHGRIAGPAGNAVVMESVGIDNEGCECFKVITCPYGQPGDRLWVRETWQGPLWDEDGPFPENGYTPEYCEYRADGGKAPWFVDADGNEHNCWRPSIHMPRWACRIVLEIVSVRVERLNDISEADALAEGIQYEERIIETRYEAGQHIEVTADMYHVDGKRSDAHYYAGECFQSLWESINGPESWAANPWVWVVEFKRVA